MDFDTEDETLDWVWEAIRSDGMATVFALSVGPRPGDAGQVLRGRALAERAFNRAMSCAEREAAAV